MALTISELYGGDLSREQAWENLLMFKTHVSLPAIVQSYDPAKQTVEVQPAIRERFVDEQGNISYRQYPLLINVPVVFPQAGRFSITFPIQQGDECLVIFSDLSIDNWWKAGNVQNPVEQRRHDLSDGMAIFGLMNQEKLKNVSSPRVGLCLRNLDTGTGITITDTDVEVKFRSGGLTRTMTMSEIWQAIHT